MSLIDKNTIRPYICGVYLCFGTSFTAQTTFQNFYDTELLEADVVSLYATSSKVSFAETKTSSRSGDLYQQRISISLPIGDDLRSENINRIHQAEQVVLKLTNGEYLYIGRNDAFQNTKPKIAYNGDENTARFQFTATSMAPFGYTDLELVLQNPDDFIFVLLDNGVTIKYLGNTPGEQGTAFGETSGKVYTAVDNTLFNALDPLTDDYTSVCTTLVTDMASSFYNIDFNQDISHFDTSNVTNMSFMFGFETFASGNSNVNVIFWNVSNVINFEGMFRSNVTFNRNISVWNTSSATDMNRMFAGADSFNQPIGIWNTSNVTNMDLMFNQNDVFNQNLTDWCVELIPSEPTNFSTGSPLTTANKPNWGAPC